MTKQLVFPRGEAPHARAVPARVRLAIGAAALGLPVFGLTACQSSTAGGAAARDLDPHYKGDPNAPLTIVEWGDFQ